MRDIFLLPTYITAEYGIYAMIGFPILLASLIGFIITLFTKRKGSLNLLYIISSGVILISPWILVLFLGDSLELFYFFSPISFLFGAVLAWVGIIRQIDKLLLILPLSTSIGYWSIAIFGEITAQI